MERALPSGVRFCIQTRSPLVEKDFDLLRDYRSQVRLQVSVATLDPKLSRAIEPRVVSPSRRVEILHKAKDTGLKTGVIIAPVFPPVKLRSDVKADLDGIACELAKIGPKHIYGESVHVRGINLAYLEDALGEPLVINGFEHEVEPLFHRRSLNDVKQQRCR